MKILACAALFCCFIIYRNTHFYLRRSCQRALEEIYWAQSEGRSPSFEVDPPGVPWVFDTMKNVFDKDEREQRGAEIKAQAEAEARRAWP